ncbi:MAG: hypothetical protein WD336_11295, partial [Trueperaceae bacterium]
MSDDARAPWTDREIVETYFPATDARLVPRTLRYRLQAGSQGRIVVIDRTGDVERGVLTPVPSAGNPTGELACDLCGRSGTRRFLALYRLEVPGSHGRRFRYLTACRDR